MTGAEASNCLPLVAAAACRSRAPPPAAPADLFCRRPSLVCSTRCQRKSSARGRATR